MLCKSYMRVRTCTHTPMPPPPLRCAARVHAQVVIIPIPKASTPEEEQKLMFSTADGFKTDLEKVVRG